MSFMRPLCKCGAVTLISVVIVPCLDMLSCFEVQGAASFEVCLTTLIFGVNRQISDRGAGPKEKPADRGKAASTGFSLCVQQVSTVGF